MFVRGLHIKFKRQSSYYLKCAIAIFIGLIVLEKLIIENGLFRRRTFFIIQDDLINYNEDDLRKEWPFQITKHYDMRDLRSYTPRLKIVPNVNTADLPGEGGFIYFLCNLKKKRVSFIHTLNFIFRYAGSDSKSFS